MNLEILELLILARDLGYHVEEWKSEMNPNIQTPASHVLIDPLGRHSYWSNRIDCWKRALWYADVHRKLVLSPTLPETSMDERFFIFFDDVGRPFVQPSNLDLTTLLAGYFEITPEQYAQFKADIWKPKPEDFRREG